MEHMRQHTDMPTFDMVAHVKRSARLPMSLVVGCVVLDALTAYPPSRAEPVGPSTMRTTALVLIVCAAAPVIGQRYASAQIYALSGALVVVAATGLHEGTVYCRLADASFIIVVGALLFSTTLFNGRGTTDVKQGIVRPLVIVMSIMLYSGARLVRNAMLMCTEVAARTEMQLDPPVEGVSLTGCSVCNAFAVTCATCSGASAMLAALVIILRVAVEPNATSEDGLSHVAMVLSVSAWLQSMSTVGSFFSFADTSSALQVLYGEGSCASGSACRGAFEFRRFNAVTHGTGESTLLLLGTLASISCVRNVYNYRECRPLPISHLRHIFVAALFLSACSVLFLAVVATSDWGHSHMYTDVAAALTIVGIAVSGLLSGWEIAGALTIFAAITLEVVFHTVSFWADVGLNTGYFTVFSNLTLLGLFLALSLVHVAMFAIEPGSYAVWTAPFFTAPERLVPWLGHMQLASSYILTAGRSVATLLMLASTSLMAVYDGGDVPRREGLYPERRGTYAFLVWHFSPAIAWSLLASYSQCRAHHKHPTRRWAFAAWVASGGATVLVYLLTLLARDGSVPRDYPSDVSVLAVVAVGSVLPPWIAYSV